jgi:subtilase-type serine protease
MSSFKKMILATTAITAISVGSIASAQTASNFSERFIRHKDATVLRILVQEYDSDSSTFENAVEYMSLNRPEILEKYLEKTRDATHAGNYDGGQSGASDLLLGMAVASAAGAAFFVAQGVEDSDITHSPAPDPIVESPPIPGSASSFETTEYKANYGLNMIGASSRYAAGGRGQGVKISILDTGIDVDNPDFAGKIDIENSYGYFGDPTDISDTGGHGTYTAGIAAALKNDYGTHGVAFESELVVFKGIPGSSSEPGLGGVWAVSINRSVNAGADVMNNSWNYVWDDNGSTVAIPITNFADGESLKSFLGSQTINSFDYAASNDLMSIVATGNDGAPQVAVNAGIPLLLNEYDGYFIAVTAVDSNANIASYSNHCGAAMNFCLSAPGSNITSTRSGGGTITMNGTSAAAPHVSGAYALLKSQSPELTAPEISQILFDTATDLGIPGVDPIYGQGLVNVAEATQPQGQLMIYQSDSTLGAKTTLSGTGIIASSAMSTAMKSALSEQELMVGDRYDRGFYIDADAIVDTKSATTHSHSSLQETQIADGLSFLYSKTGTGLQYKGEKISYTLSHGKLEQDTLSPLSMVSSDMAASYAVDISNNVSLLAGFSGSNSETSNTASNIGLSITGAGNSAFTTKVGLLQEDGSVLGSQFLGAAGQSGSSNTSFFEISSRIGLPSNSYLDISGARSETNFSQQGMITGGKNLAGSSGKIALGKKGFLGLPGTFVAAVSTPLQVTSGTIDVTLPTSRAASNGGAVSTGVNQKSQSLDFNTDARPYDLTLSYSAGETNSGTSIMINTGFRAQGTESRPFFGLSLSKQF